MNRFPLLKKILIAMLLGLVLILVRVYFIQLSDQELDGPSEVVIKDGEIYPDNLPKGVYLLIETDMEFAIARSLDLKRQELGSFLRNKKIKFLRLKRLSDHLFIRFQTAEFRELARKNLKQAYNDQFIFSDYKIDKGISLKVTLTEQNIANIKQQILKKNISVLRKRVKELGITKSVIKKQGLNQIVVQLLDTQDPTQAKEIFGTSAVLEFRLVDESADAYKAQKTGKTPLGSKLYLERNGTPILLKWHVMLTSKNIARAFSDPDTNQQPSINITLDEEGSKLFSITTRTNIQRLMAVVLTKYKFEVKKVEDGSLEKKVTTISQVINVARIQSELSKRFQITGLDSMQEARNLAQSINTGALAAPVYIIEEHIIGDKTK